MACKQETPTPPGSGLVVTSQCPEAVQQGHLLTPMAPRFSECQAGQNNFFQVSTEVFTKPNVLQLGKVTYFKLWFTGDFQADEAPPYHHARKAGREVQDHQFPFIFCDTSRFRRSSQHLMNKEVWAQHDPTCSNMIQFAEQHATSQRFQRPCLSGIGWGLIRPIYLNSGYPLAQLMLNIILISVLPISLECLDWSK